MQHHVRLQGAHEKERRGPGIAFPDHSRLHGAAEVVGDDRQTAAWRTVGGIGIERDDQRTGAVVHVDGDVLGDDFFGEGNEVLSDRAQDDARICPGIDMDELENEIRRAGDARAHRRLEQLLFRVEVTQDGRGGHAQLRRDIGERGALESLYREHPAGGFTNLLPADARRAAHL
jgi:hypothetical protein